MPRNQLEHLERTAESLANQSLGPQVADAAHRIAATAGGLLKDASFMSRAAGISELPRRLKNVADQIDVLVIQQPGALASYLPSIGKWMASLAGDPTTPPPPPKRPRG
jgi:hypothetical protein